MERDNVCCVHVEMYREACRADFVFWKTCALIETVEAVEDMKCRGYEMLVQYARVLRQRFGCCPEVGCSGHQHAFEMVQTCGLSQNPSFSACTQGSRIHSVTNIALGIESLQR